MVNHYEELIQTLRSSHTSAQLNIIKGGSFCFGCSTAAMNRDWQIGQVEILDKMPAPTQLCELGNWPIPSSWPLFSHGQENYVLVLIGVRKINELKKKPVSNDMLPLRSDVRTFSKGLCCHCENCVFLKGCLQEIRKDPRWSTFFKPGTQLNSSVSST